MVPPTNQANDERNTTAAIDRRKQAIGLLSGAIRELGWRYWFFCLATLSLATATLLPPELFRTFTTALKSDDFNPQMVLTQIAIFGSIVAAILLVTSFMNILCREWLRLNLQANLRRRVLRKLHSLPVEATDEAEHGEWLTRMTADLSNVESFMTESIPEQMRDGAVVVGVAGLFLWHVGPLALLPIGTALGLAGVNYLVHRKLAPVLEDLRTLNGRVFGALIENFEGRKTIRSLGGEKQATSQFESKLQAIIKSGFRVVRLLGGLMAQNRFFSEVMITIALTAAVWSFGLGQMSIGEALIVPFYIGMFFNAAQGLAHAGFGWNRYFAEGGRLASLLALPEHASQHTEMTSEEASTAQRLSATDLKVGYRGRAVASSLSFSCKRGESVAFVGPSGCGKSTTLEVLAGLRRPMAGSLRVFTQDKSVLWETGYTARLPRTLASYVEQRPYIFAGTIKDNLLFGLPSLPQEEQLWTTLERVGLAGWIRTLEKTLDHEIADRGDNLSEGQRYRLAIARALLTNRPYLLLDEPFAALDDISVQFVLKALSEERSLGRGIIVVTHVLPPGFLCDEILEFDALEEEGTRSGFANLPGLADMPLQGGFGERGRKRLENHKEKHHAQRDRT